MLMEENWKKYVEKKGETLAITITSKIAKSNNKWIDI